MGSLKRHTYSEHILTMLSKQGGERDSVSNSSNMSIFILKNMEGGKDTAKYVYLRGSIQYRLPATIVIYYNRKF